MFAPLTAICTAILWQWQISKDSQNVCAANPCTRRVLKAETKTPKNLHGSRREARENSVLSCASHTNPWFKNHLNPSKPVPDHIKAWIQPIDDLFMDYNHLLMNIDEFVQKPRFPLYKNP